MDLINLDTLRSVEELANYQKEVRGLGLDINKEFEGLPLPEDKAADLARLKDADDEIGKRVTELNGRKALVERWSSDERKHESDEKFFRDQPRPSLREHDIYDMATVPTDGRRGQAILDRAKRSVELSTFPHPDAEAARAKDRVLKLLDPGDAGDEWTSYRAQHIAQRILLTGSPTYRKAFGKYLLGAALTAQEQGSLAEVQRALSIGTGSAGGFAVVYTLDPTVVPTSNFSVNPYRALARTETIAGTNEWKAVTSGAITAAYSAEANEASDNAPTVAQPDIIVEKAQAYVPFSIEVGQDWSALQTEMAQLLQDAKDDLEATKFAVGAGHGSTEPKGIITAATATTTAGGTGAFAIADVYKVFEALPPRFRPRAQFVANLFIIDKIRQFDTSGGSGVWIGPQGLQPSADSLAAGRVSSSVGVPLLGRNVWESTAMASALTTGSKIMLVGDFRYFVIVDRVGLNIEVLPLVVGTNHRPTGQRGLYAYWRNSSDALSASAFQVLVTG